MISVTVGSPMFANDIVIITDANKKMQKLINIWVEEIEKIKIKIDTDEWKIMITNKQKTKHLNSKIRCKKKQIE